MNQETKQKLIDAGYKGGFFLEELIEACGEGFKMVRKHGKQFDAVGSSPSEDYVFTKLHPTPLIAVANLWLALNNK